MFNKYFNSLTLYLLAKSRFERVVILLIFFLALYVMCAFLWRQAAFGGEFSAQYKNIDSNVELGKIAAMAKKYDIKSKCLRLFCDDGEIDSKFKGFSTADLKSENTQDSKGENIESSSDFVTKFMHFSCNSLKCFEFVREMESLPLVFITEINGFDVLLLHVRDEESSTDSIESAKVESNEKQNILDFLFNDSESAPKEAHDKELESLDSKALPIQWRQDIKLKLRIEQVHILES